MSCPPGLLSSGWHVPEHWGCWTSGQHATLRGDDEPFSGRFRVALDLAALPIRSRSSCRSTAIVFRRVSGVGRTPGLADRLARETGPTWCIACNRCNLIDPAISADPPTLGSLVSVSTRSGFSRSRIQRLQRNATIRIHRGMTSAEILREGWHKPNHGDAGAVRRRKLHLGFDAPSEVNYCWT